MTDSENGNTEHPPDDHETASEVREVETGLPGASGSDSSETARTPLRRSQDQFADGFTADLASSFCGEVDVTSCGWTRQTYTEFLAAIREPTACCILGAQKRAVDPSGTTASETKPAGEGVVWLEIASQVAHVLIEAMLGGSQSEGSYLPQRPLTPLEQRLLRRVADLAG